MYIHVHVHVHVHIHIQIHLHMHIHMHLHVQTHVHIHIHTHTHTPTHTQACIHTHTVQVWSSVERAFGTALRSECVRTRCMRVQARSRATCRMTSLRFGSPSQSQYQFVLLLLVWRYGALARRFVQGLRKVRWSASLNCAFRNVDGNVRSRVRSAFGVRNDIFTAFGARSGTPKRAFVIQINRARSGTHLSLEAHPGRAVRQSVNTKRSMNCECVWTCQKYAVLKTLFEKCS